MRFLSHSLSRPLAAALTAAALVAVPGTSHAAFLGFSLTIDDITNSVTSSLAGVTVTTLGTQRWSIDFSGSPIDSFPSFAGANNLSWVSGDDDTGVNWLRQSSGSVFLLDGDTTNPAALAGDCGTPAPLAQGVTCYIGDGGGDTYFVTVLDRTGTVSSPATLALAGLGLLAAAGVSRRRR